MNRYPLPHAGLVGATAGAVVLAVTLLPPLAMWLVLVPTLAVTFVVLSRTGQFRIDATAANYPGAALGAVLPLVLGVPALAIRGTATAALWGPVLAVVAVIGVTIAFRLWMPWKERQEA